MPMRHDLPLAAIIQRNFPPAVTLTSPAYRYAPVMSRKKISTTIYVTPEQSERLRLLHERTKVPVAVYIREGIDLVLRQYGHLLPGQLSLAGDATGTAPAPAAGRVDGDTKAAPHRSERASSDRGAPVEAIPERAAGGKG